MILDEALLDDPARLQAGESGELLRVAAGGGAQVRSTAEAAAERSLGEMLAGLRPRALVLLTRPGIGSRAAGVLRALLGPRCPVPVVLTDGVPPWVGSLDVLYAHSSDPGDNVLAESIDMATRRGAHVVLSAAPEGPVAAAAAGRAVLLSPRVTVPPTLMMPTALTAALLVSGALDLLRTDLWALADELDREAERNHPMHESFVSPAKALALRVAGRAPLLLGLDAVATAVGKHAAASIGAHSGLLAVATGYREALAQPALHRAAVLASAPADIFRDPYADEAPLIDQPLRVLLLTVSGDDPAGVSRQAATGALASADLIAPADEVSGDEPLLAALLASRFDLAALYLGLASGTLGGPGLTAPVIA